MLLMLAQNIFTWLERWFDQILLLIQMLPPHLMSPKAFSFASILYKFSTTFSLIVPSLM